METKYTVLGFDTPQGHVNHHELVRHRYSWLKSAIKSVVFETYDSEAQMLVEIVVHWTRFTEYTKKKWPAGGSVKAVLLDDGTRVYAEERFCGHTDKKSYEAAPLICRDSFKILTMGGCYPLIEVAGVEQWLYSKRDQAATDEFLVDPVKRDRVRILPSFVPSFVPAPRRCECPCGPERFWSATWADEPCHHCGREP